MIEIEHLGKRYGDTTAVDRVSMTIPDREIVTIVGKSGSGKTTLLRMINRLVEPSEGRVKIDGVDTRRIAGPVLRRSIGYVIQGNGLFPHRTVAENIGTVPVLLGWKSSRIDARVRELMELLELPPGTYARRLPHELSGGQQQRVGVARALTAEPRILLMDEPFAALDPVIRTKAREDLTAIARRFGTTIVLVTHDMEEAILLGDRIAVMDEGRLMQYATPAELLSRPASPEIEALVGAAERPFRLLSLQTVASAIEPGAAEGDPIPDAASLRDALAELIWTGRTALPVRNGAGAIVGRISLDGILRRATRPA